MTTLFAVDQAPPCQINHMLRTQVGSDLPATLFFLSSSLGNCVHSQAPLIILHPHRADVRRDVWAQGEQDCGRLLRTYWDAPVARCYLSAARRLPLRRFAHLSLLGCHRRALFQEGVRHNTHTSSTVSYARGLVSHVRVPATWCPRSYEWHNVIFCLFGFLQQ